MHEAVVLDDVDVCAPALECAAVTARSAQQAGDEHALPSGSTPAAAEPCGSCSWLENGRGRTAGPDGEPGAVGAAETGPRSEGCLIDLCTNSMEHSAAASHVLHASQSMARLNKAEKENIDEGMSRQHWVTSSSCNHMHGHVSAVALAALPADIRLSLIHI